MAQHPIWRGHLRLALVSCPVALYSAHRDSGNLHFHLINPRTGHRVRMVTTDAETGEELQRRDLVKGYEFKKDTYVVLEDADFERAKIESSDVLNVAKFVPADSIDPVYFDSSYFVAPDGDTGADVFAVLREAIGKSDKVAMSRLVIARRERAAAILPMGRGLVLHTLYEPRDLQDFGKLFASVPDAIPEPDMVALAMQLVERQTRAFDPGDMEDRYEARLREVIDGKLAGHPEAAEHEDEPDRSNVIDLMTALKRSLGDGAKAVPPKKAAARAAANPAPAKKSTTKKAAAAPPKPKKVAAKPARKRA